MRDYRRFWVLWSPLAYMAGIFLLSSVPGEIHPEEPGMLRVFLWVPPDVQNLLHVPVFAGLAWLWCGSLQRLRLPQGTVIWLALVITDGQFDALVSFTFNLGTGVSQRSTLRRKENREEHAQVLREFMRWVWAGGRRLQGLIEHRAAGTANYFSLVY